MIDVTARVFAAMQNLDIGALATYPQSEIRSVLPSLVRMSLLSPLDNTKTSMESRKQILAVLIGIEVVNSIVSYLQVNYHELEQELKKELQIRQKALFCDGQPNEFGLQTGIALGFERADVTRKVRVVISEIFNIQQQISEQKVSPSSEVLDDGIYLEEVVDVLCIALAELPSLLNILDLTDALVHIPNGQRIVCALVANFPDSYRDVVSHVIVNCDEESSEGKLKLSLLIALSEINPSQALSIRAICMEMQKVPSFMLKLCLKYPEDLIAFLTGLLLGNDQNVRSWFAVFMRSSQKRKSDSLSLVRAELLQQLQRITQITVSSTEPVWREDYTVQGAVLLRLYCALRGIAGLKFNDEEINALSQLVTSRPQPNQSGLRFVSLALCMLIACPSLVSTTSLENKSIEWLQWLIKEEAFYEIKSDSTSSLGEMLLLLAIHFHSNQIAAIGELCCATLAMKIPIRPNSTNRIKQLFTQDLFTEQVVASHAVRVPVTPNLNAHIPGYLPVHCIHQLLKSRAFLKHKVPIKSWIYRQMCCSVRPLHPVMPALIEVFVGSLILPNNLGKIGNEHMHKPFSETEILHIFKASCIAQPFAEDGGNRAFKLSLALENNENSNVEVQCPTTAQLLMLYFLVLYEDTRLSNAANVAFGGRKLKEYSNEFLSELPMKNLLQKAQQYNNDYIGIFHPLLRLIISNYPHLSMVEDWLDEHYISTGRSKKLMYRTKVDRKQLVNALKKLKTKPALAIRVFRILTELPPEQLVPFAELIVKYIPEVFNRKIPRFIQDLYKNIWFRLNSVLPVCFWKISLNAIMFSDDHVVKAIQDNTSILDPLQVLRCGKEVFDSPFTLMILLRILQGSLAASKAYLNIQMQAKQMLDKSALCDNGCKNGQIQCDSEREELKTALIASQESAAVQILLEVLADKKKNLSNAVSILELREMQGIVCSFIHQAFISEPSLAKLVHFQTYPREVIPMMVMGVPSMHICIDFLHEFLSVAEMDKQVFTIDLTSHLVLKYAIPKSLSISKFCVNTIQSSLSLLSTNAKCQFLTSILPALIRFAEAFPILVDDCINILMSTGRSLYSQGTLGISSTQLQLTSFAKLKSYRDTQGYILMIEEAFETLITKILNKVELY